jgi:hypothetical protein
MEQASNSRTERTDDRHTAARPRCAAKQTYKNQNTTSGRENSTKYQHGPASEGRREGLTLLV